MGTPYYMSPEQARGERNLDARVDLYACGVILYEALTGRRPFTAANYNALLLQILNAKPRPARDLRPALPAGFDAVLDKAMARSREDRYATAADFQRDLQTLRDRHNTRGGPPPETARFTGRARTPLEAAQGRAQRSEEKEPPSSSVEIPITITTETPAALAPVDPTGGPRARTRLGSRRRERKRGGESGRTRAHPAHGSLKAARAMRFRRSSLPEETIYIGADAGRIENEWSAGRVGVRWGRGRRRRPFRRRAAEGPGERAGEAIRRPRLRASRTRGCAPPPTSTISASARGGSSTRRGAAAARTC